MKHRINNKKRVILWEYRGEMKEIVHGIIVLAIFLGLGAVAFEYMLMQAVGRNKNRKREDEEQISFLRGKRKGKRKNE